MIVRVIRVKQLENCIVYIDFLNLAHESNRILLYIIFNCVKYFNAQSVIIKYE